MPVLFCVALARCRHDASGRGARGGTPHFRSGSPACTLYMPFHSPSHTLQLKFYAKNYTQNPVNAYVNTRK